MSDGYHFKNCDMQYFSNHLTDIYEICIVMHISRSYPIGDQKFENLNIWKSKIADRGYLKNRKNTLHFVCPILNKIWHGGVDLASVLLA